MSILDELLRATELEVPTNPDDTWWVKLLTQVANEDVVTEKRWVSLSDDAQEWANTGHRAIKARKKKARDGKAWVGELADLEIEPLPVPVPKAEPEPEPEPPKPAPEPEAKLSDLADLGLEPDGGNDPKEPEPKPEKPKEPAAAPKKKAAKKKTARRKKAAKKTTVSKPVEPELVEPKPVEAKPVATKPTAGKKVSRLKGKKKQRRAASYKAGSCYWLVRYVLANVKTMQELEPGEILRRFEEKNPGILIPRGTANTTVYTLVTVLRALRDSGKYAHPMMKDFPKVTAKVPNAPPDS